MDTNGRYEIKMEHYRALLREAEEYRLARELGFSEADVLRSIAAKLWAWLPQIRIISLKVIRRFNPAHPSRTL
jgi:hypothetical protein